MPWNPTVPIHACSDPLHSPLCTPPPLPTFLSECLTSKPCPLYMLSNSLYSLLSASKSPQTHSVHFQVLSDPLHSYPAAFISSLFPSLFSLGTPLLSSHKLILTISPLYARASSISVCMHPYLLRSPPRILSLLCPFQCLLSADFSPLCTLTSLFSMTRALRFPLLPSIDTQIPPVPSLDAQFLWVPLSDPFQSLYTPPIPLHSLSMHTGSSFLLTPLYVFRPLHSPLYMLRSLLLPSIWQTLAFLCSHPSCMTSLPNPVPQRPQQPQLAYRNLLASVFQQAHSAGFLQISTVAHWETETSPAPPRWRSLLPQPSACCRAVQKTPAAPNTVPQQSVSLGVSGLL